MNIVEKKEHGEFIWEWMREMALLAKDRKTVFVSASPMEKLTSQLEEILSQVRRSGFSI